MNTIKKYEDTIQIIITLAFFNFIFLGTEFLFDNMMGYVTDASGVTKAQNYVLGISAIGFLLYHPFSTLIRNEIKMVATVVAMMISVICIFVIQEHNNYLSIMIAGCVIFVIMGMVGSTVCFFATQLINNTRNLAKIIGASYAFGVLIQFINNNAVKNDQIESIVISVFVLILGILLLVICMKHNFFTADQDVKCKNETELKNPVLAGCSLGIAVLLMTCIFSTLDNAVTLVHASGQFNIGQWPRAILAVSGLAAGLLYDIYGRRFMNAIMYIVTLLSVMCVVVIQLGGTFVIGLIVFYISAGFFVVFFMTSFMDISYKMTRPKIWAGLGRAINNICAFITTGITVALINAGDTLMIMIASLILFAMISVALIVYQYQISSGEKEVVIVEKKETVYQMMQIDEKEKFRAFSEKFSLTERERDVLKALLEMDDNVQEIAEALAISRAALYRHISNLNEKTNTKSRIGIMQFYYSWKME